jgi:hypothetical protein
VVAQVDEQQAAVVAYAMDPAGKADGLADIGLPQLSAGVAAVAVHDGRFPIEVAGLDCGIRPRNRREKRTQGAFCQGELPSPSANESNGPMLSIFIQSGVYTL